MRCAVDEIREGDQGGGQADCWSIERGDQDLGMCVESMRNV